jgi:hypothetical protein
VKTRRAVAGWLVCASALATTAATETEATACPCRGAAGPGAPLTAPYERWSAQATPGFRSALGTFDRHGHFRRFGDDEEQSATEVAVSLARRFASRVEISATTSAGRNVLRAPGFARTTHNLGDVLLRGHVDLLDPPMPTMGSFPAWGVGVLVRSPTGRALGTGGGTATNAATNASTGLGAWELGVSSDLRKYWTPRWETALAGEVAFRTADHRTGAERHLGPRATGRTTLAYVPNLSGAVGLSADLTWEGDVRYAGETLAGTATRLVNVSAFGSRRFENGLRLGLSVFVSPPIRGLSANAAALLGSTLIVGWSR